MKPRISLETLSNIAVLVACVWAGYALYNRPAAASPPPAPTRPTYAIGDASEIQGLDYSAADATVVLFVRKSCQFCTASMPFYNRLTTKWPRGREARHVQFVVITTDDDATAATYLSTFDVSVDVLRANERPPNKVFATPTVLIVAADGRVRGAWTGQLSEAGEAEVVATLESLVGSRVS
ncbi:MAG: hypothetical protein R2745_02140 [Vicinamibacterales bacterium]